MKIEVDWKYFRQCVRWLALLGLLIVALSFFPRIMNAQEKSIANDIGICSYLQWRARDGGWDWASFCATQMRELGIKWDRGSGIRWEYIEPKKGDWKGGVDYQALFLLVINDIEPVVTLGPGVPKWASSYPENDEKHYSLYPPRNVSDWREYIRMLVTHLGHSKRGLQWVRYWEIWNEPDITKFYRGSIHKLVKLTNVAYETIKEVDPTAVILSPGFCGFGHKEGGYVDKYLSYNPKFDIYNMHTYSRINYTDEIKEAQALLEKHNLDKPIWITETNLDIYGSSDEQLLVAEVPRRLKNILKTGAAKVFWFQLVDQAPEEHNNGHTSYTGLLRLDGSRKDVFYVIQQFLSSVRTGPKKEKSFKEKTYPQSISSDATNSRNN